MELIVLYRTKADDQFWMTFDSVEDADAELDGLSERYEGIEEISRIEITRTANVLFFIE